MKIVIPTNNKKGLNDKITEHFSYCKTYTFLDEKGKVIEIIDNISEYMGGAGLAAELIKKHGADILLCKDLELMALNLCQELEIKLYVCQAETVKEIFEMWKNNKIKKASAENTCGQY